MIIGTVYRHDGRADYLTYTHDGRADCFGYRHDKLAYRSWSQAVTAKLYMHF